MSLFGILLKTSCLFKLLLPRCHCYTPMPLALTASSLHFFLAILWRMDAFSLKCPATEHVVQTVTRHVRWGQIEWKQRNCSIFSFIYLNHFQTWDNVWWLYLHYWGGPVCESWAGRCCSSSGSCVEKHSCLPSAASVWPAM